MRQLRLLEVGLSTLAAAAMTLSIGIGQGHAAVPMLAVPFSGPVPVSPPPVSRQVRQALTRLNAAIAGPHAGTAEKLTHPNQDSAGWATLIHSQAPAHSGPNTSSQQPSATAAMQAGLDVSSYQGNVNWGAVAGNGATFAYVKATEGTYYTSAFFGGQYTGSYAAGLIRGAYHFAIPNNSTGAVQADFFVADGGGWAVDRRTLPGMLDIEYNPYGPECYGLTAAQVVTWVASFDAEYHQLTTRWPDIYTTTDWWSTCTGNSPAFGQESLSIANWSGSPLPLPPGWTAQTFWQWADSGIFPGDQERFNGSRQALIDFAAGQVRGAFTALGPVRMLDTRAGIGSPRSAVAAWATLSAQVEGTNGVPPSGVSAVAVNVTVTQPAAAGHLTVYPAGAARPTTSNVNFTPGQTVANLVIVPVAADGRIALFNSSPGPVQLIGDIAGYYLVPPS